MKIFKSLICKHAILKKYPSKIIWDVGRWIEEKENEEYHCKLALRLNRYVDPKCKNPYNKKCAMKFEVDIK